jgi:hypothetical protein
VPLYWLPVGLPSCLLSVLHEMLLCAECVPHLLWHGMSTVFGVHATTFGSPLLVKCRRASLSWLLNVVMFIAPCPAKAQCVELSGIASSAKQFFLCALPMP